MAFAQDALTRTRQLPNGDRIVAAGYILAGFGITRDSDPLAESNYHVAIREIAAAAGIDPSEVGVIGRPWIDADPYDLPVGIASFRHWACGWIDELVVRADHAAAIACAASLVDRVADYPVLDEDHYAAVESLYDDAVAIAFADEIDVRG